MENEKKKTERDFHHGEGHSIPFVIKFVWSIFFVVAIVYIVKFCIPDLQVWLSK